MEENLVSFDYAISYLWRPFPIVNYAKRINVSKGVSRLGLAQSNIGRVCRRCAAPAYASGLCEKCYRRDSGMISDYGISFEEKLRLIDIQGSICLICNRPFGEGKRIPCVDHAKHEPKKRCVRGILCDGCNTGIGNFGHSTETLLAAKNYLIADMSKFGTML